MHISTVARYLLLFAIVITSNAFAGRSCEEKPLSIQTFAQAMHTGQMVNNKLNETGAKVVVLARIGQDLSKYGLRYSHMGYAYRSNNQSPWRIAELLNDCGTANSNLWRNGIGNFFLDDLHAFDTLVLIPPVELQKRLLSILENPVRMNSLHGNAYNLVAYPFSSLYQNSNQWVLEILAAASNDSITTRNEAQAWLQQENYRPTELSVGTFSRLGGRIFKANVAFNDHPDELRYSNRIRTITVDSFVNFVKQRKEGWEIFEIKSTPAPAIP